MDPSVLNAKLDRLLALRGDPVKGLPETAWAEALETVDRALLMRAAIDVVRELAVPDWADRRKDDKRPQKALEATEAWLAQPTDETLKQVKAAAKACTAARSETFGYDHRVAEAARAVAWTAGAKDAAHVWEALSCVEEELLARIALTSEYHRGPEMRRSIVDIVRRVLAPPPEPAAPAPVRAVPAGPVAYSADGHFELGQRLVHKKFGDVTVTSVGETWIEVELGDGSKKRLAQKP